MTTPEPTQTVTDEQLAAAHLDGDDTAMRTLIERYHDPLLGFLIRFIGDRARAEDVFQDTFLQVHLSMDRFDTEKRFKPWLFTIAANKARDAMRWSKRRPELSFDAPLSKGSEGRSVVSILESPDDNAVGATLENADEKRSELVQQAIDALTETQREILLLSYFQQLTYQQLAEVLELPLGTVKSRLHGAVAAFSRNYKHIIELQDQTDSD